MTRLKKPIAFETTFTRYEATERLGDGGTGTVFRGTNDAGGEVAIKLLDPSKANAERRRRFKNEIQFGLRNQHRNVVTVLDHGLFIRDGETSPFYVMPVYAGSLRTLMNGISHDKILRYFSHCLDGVEAAHLQSVVHRDLKPENILHDVKNDRLVIADFGIAEFTQDELYTLVETKPNTRLANFQYAAPEQRQRGGTCDARTDIFALGLIVNEMFTGSVPSGTGYATIGSIAPELAYLDELVGLMIRQNPSERPSSIEDVKRELIGRGKAFVERQTLSRQTRAVIPKGSVDDPIVANPIRVVDRDWDNNVLTLKLSQPVNPEWTQIIQFGSYSRSSLLGKGPEAFQFRGDTATVGNVRAQDAQQVIDHFKSWLPHANQIYADHVRRKNEKEEQRQREALAREIRAREERAATLGRLKI